MTKEKFCQDVSKKVIISRELRRRNFGRQDHKRKAWWTVLQLRQVEEERIKNKEFWADAIRYARLCFARTHSAGSSESSTTDRDKEVIKSPSTRSWLTLIIRLLMFLGAFLCMTCNQFGKEYSSCTAGDGPPKKIQKTADNEEIHSTAAGK